MTIANYVSNFDSFHGEKFAVEPAAISRPPSTDKLVRSTLKTGNQTIPFNYRMHQVGEAWKIEDIYLNGNISQMAQQRSDFHSPPFAYRRRFRRGWPEKETQRCWRTSSFG